MAYIGREPGNSGVTFKSFTASGADTYSLDESASTNSVIVSIGGVLQKPVTDYSVSGTTLTTTETIATGIVIDTYIIHDAGGSTPVIEDNSVTTSKIADNHVTGAKIAMGSDAAGDVLYYNGTDYVRLAKGTATQVLAMNSGATAPEWVAAGGGSLNYVNSVTLSGGDAAFTGLTTYDTYFFRYEGLVGSASANDRIVMSDDNGSSYESSGYAWSGMSYPSNGSLSNPYHRTDSSIDLSYTYAGSSYRAGWLYLHRKGKSATGAIINSQNWGLEDASGYETGRVVGGRLDTGTIVNAIKFYRSSGNYSAGKIYVYGISNS